MSERMPALSLAAVPGRRAQTIELAAEIERRGFSGIYCPSFGDAMGLCLSIAQATTTIEFGTSIQPIYLQHPVALATSASYLHELADGRFRLGVGVTHGPVISRLGCRDRQAAERHARVRRRRCGPPASRWAVCLRSCSPTLRDKMVELVGRGGRRGGLGECVAEPDGALARRSFRPIACRRILDRQHDPHRDR